MAVLSITFCAVLMYCFVRPSSPPSPVVLFGHLGKQIRLHAGGAVVRRMGQQISVAVNAAGAAGVPPM